MATALLNDQLFVTTIGDDQVSVYNTTSFQLLRQFTFSGLSGHLYGLATSAINNYLYIADVTSSKVYGVDLSVTNNVSAMTLCSVLQPLALSVTIAGNVLVTNGTGIISEYAPDGLLVRQTNVGFAIYIYHAVDAGNGVLVFSQVWPFSMIVMMLRNGTVLKSYGPETVGPGLMGSMSNPTTLALDTRGYILVADYYNNRILVVNPSMTAAGLLPLPANTALKHPSTLTLDSLRGRLYIGEDNGGLSRLLVFDGVTNLYALFNEI